MDRRRFLSTSAAATALAATVPQAPAAASVGLATARNRPAEAVADAFDRLAAGAGATLNRKTLSVRGYLIPARDGHRHYVLLADRTDAVDPLSRAAHPDERQRLVRLYIDPARLPVGSGLEVEVTGRFHHGGFYDLPSDSTLAAVMTNARVRPVL